MNTMGTVRRALGRSDSAEHEGGALLVLFGLHEGDACCFQAPERAPWRYRDTLALDRDTNANGTVIERNRYVDSRPP